MKFGQEFLQNVLEKENPSANPMRNYRDEKFGMEKHVKICLVPRLSGIGGMVSFQKKFAAGLKGHKVDICYDLGEPNIDAVLVIGGTRQLHLLWRMKRQGIRIVQRLNGMNWVHRVLNTGSRHRVRAEYGNLILTIIRSKLADRVAYQSEFSRKWWEREKGRTPSQFKVIHNAVDLTEFLPGNSQNLAADPIRILLVEGSLLGGYEFGLENGVRLASSIAHSHNYDRKVELMVVGKVSPNLRDRWESWMGRDKSIENLSINWVGSVPHNQIADVYRQAHVFFSADINAACPNSVIESLACGLPVVAYDTGALTELIGPEGGVTVPYGGDPWQLEPPDLQALSHGAITILNNLDTYRSSARIRAEEAFDLDTMIDAYLELLFG